MVKRLSSILFLVILLFNLWGYRFMIDCLQQQQDAILSNRLDKKQYKEEELISIKTALNLPYYSSSPTFERAFGSVTVNGVDYEYVQQRVFNDTLELRCLPNQIKTELQTVKNQFLKFSIDDPTTQPVKKQTILKSGLPDFVQNINVMTQSSESELISNFTSYTPTFILQGFVESQDRPPQGMQCTL